jgi:glyoxylase-like metal-dependent hydrolase (beta-lactamase superfamily II)
VWVLDSCTEVGDNSGNDAGPGGDPSQLAARAGFRATPFREVSMADGAAAARIDILVIGYADASSVAATVGLVRDGGRVIVIDPGQVRGREMILDPLAKLGLWADDVSHVFVTHHHLAHTMNIALFRKAELVDYRNVRRGDQVTAHQGEGYKISPNATVWLTPGHTPQDATLFVQGTDGRHAFTHLWWRTDRSPAVDPYCTDPAELARNRQRVLDNVDVVVPGHGAPFRVR